MPLKGCHRNQDSRRRIAGHTIGFIEVGRLAHRRCQRLAGALNQYFGISSLGGVVNSTQSDPTFQRVEKYTIKGEPGCSRLYAQDINDHMLSMTLFTRLTQLHQGLLRWDHR